MPGAKWVFLIRFNDRWVSCEGLDWITGIFQWRRWNRMIVCKRCYQDLIFAVVIRQATPDATPRHATPRHSFLALRIYFPLFAVGSGNGIERDWRWCRSGWMVGQTHGALIHLEKASGTAGVGHCILWPQLSPRREINRSNNHKTQMLFPVEG